MSVNSASEHGLLSETPRTWAFVLATSQGPRAAKRHGLDPAGKESIAYIPPDLDLSSSELYMRIGMAWDGSCGHGSYAFRVGNFSQQSRCCFVNLGHSKMEHHHAEMPGEKYRWK